MAEEETRRGEVERLEKELEGLKMKQQQEILEEANKGIRRTVPVNTEYISIKDAAEKFKNFAQSQISPLTSSPTTLNPLIPAPPPKVQGSLSIQESLAELESFVLTVQKELEELCAILEPLVDLNQLPELPFPARPPVPTELGRKVENIFMSIYGYLS